MNKKRFVGFCLLLAGLLLSLSTPTFTGAVVGIEKSSISSFLGAAIVLAGVLLVLVGHGEQIVERKSKAYLNLVRDHKSGRSGTYDELRHYAKRLGFRLQEGGGHTKVRDLEGHLITVIPRHKGGAKKGTYRSIQKDLLERHAA